MHPEKQRLVKREHWEELERGSKEMKWRRKKKNVRNGGWKKRQKSMSALEEMEERLEARRTLHSEKMDGENIICRKLKNGKSFEILYKFPPFFLAIFIAFRFL